MATQAQIEASRANGKKSKGPKTPAGRLAASLNATKHGRRSIKAAHLRGDSLTFEERRCKWLGAEDPQTDMGEYLVAQLVALSCEFDRTLQAHIQRLNTAIDNMEDNEGEKTFDMLDQLFGDPAGHRCLFGILPHNRTKLEKTSGDGVDPDELNPRKLVAALEASEMGCTALYSTWQDLRFQLDGTTGTFWQPLDRLKACRLLGCNPIQANENLQVAEIFVASHALHSAGRENAFHDIRSDMSDTQHDLYCKVIQARWPEELKLARKPAHAREILIDLCDEYIEKLADKLVEHAENKEKHIRESVTSLKLDYTPEGKDARAYLMKCDSAVKRSVEALRKYKAEQRKNQGGRGYEEPRKIQEPGLTRKRRDGSADEANLLNPDISWAQGPYPGGDAPTAKQRNEGRWAEAANCQLSIPEFEPLIADANVSGNRSGQRRADQRDASERNPERENCQNATNEPEPPQNVNIANIEEAVGVVANSAADSGLDKCCPQSVVSSPISVVNGPSSANDTGRPSDETRDESKAEKLDASDHAPDSGIATQPADPQLPTTDSRIASEMSREGKKCQNMTNEPELSQNVNSDKTEEAVGVVANSDVNSGLDSLAQPDGASSVVMGPLSGDTQRRDSLADRTLEESRPGRNEEQRTVRSVSEASNRESQNANLKAAEPNNGPSP